MSNPIRLYMIRLQHLWTALPYFLTSERIYRDLLKAIDVCELQRIQRTYTSQKLTPGQGAKFVNSSKYIRQSIRWALMLGLDGAPKRTVLDLGCGAGYFLLVCRHLGHSVQGIDIPDSPFFNDMISFFAIPRTIHRVEAFQKLPAVETPLDLITAWGICFDRGWGVSEWGFFLKDVQSRLAPGGRLVLGLNIAEVRGIHEKHDLKALFCTLPNFDGRIVDRRTIIFQRQGVA